MDLELTVAVDGDVPPVRAAVVAPGGAFADAAAETALVAGARQPLQPDGVVAVVPRRRRRAASETRVPSELHLVRPATLGTNTKQHEIVVD